MEISWTDHVKNEEVLLRVKEQRNILHGIVNPLLLLFKALLQGQKDRVLFSGHLIYILQQERFRAFRPAQDI
jgi:hypothetical protein